MLWILTIVGVVIIALLAGYAAHLWLALQKQKKAFAQARAAREARLIESILIIAKAMQTGDCNHSEGVIRLKMLLDPLGKKLSDYASMFALYEVVKDMPTHEARSALKKNERMRLDLMRETAEVDFAEGIQSELNTLRQQFEK